MENVCAIQDIQSKFESNKYWILINIKTLINQIFVNCEFIENGASMDHRVNGENGHMPTFVEFHLTSFAQMQSALNFVENVFLQCTMDGHPNKCVEKNGKQIANSASVKNTRLWKNIIFEMIFDKWIAPVSFGNVIVSLYCGTMKTCANDEVALNINPSIMNIITQLEPIGYNYDWLKWTYETMSPWFWMINSCERIGGLFLRPKAAFFASIPILKVEC